VRSYYQLRRIRTALNDLAKALVYQTDAPFYIDAHCVPFLNSDLDPKRTMRRRRWVQAYFAFHGLQVVPTFGFQSDNDAELVVGCEGVVYPLRALTVPFSVYETAIILIRDGSGIAQAFESAWLLERY